MMPQDTGSYFWQSERIRLRAVRSEDWELGLQESTDTEGIRVLNYTVELPSSKELEKARTEKWVDFRSNERIMFSIETLAGELVGGINLWGRDHKNGTFSFGIRIAREHRRKGYGEDALRILLRYAFYELRLQKCNSACIELNRESIGLLKKIGFREEGRRRRSIYTNGQFHDNVLLGLTREEFDKNEGRI